MKVSCTLTDAATGMYSELMQWYKHLSCKTGSDSYVPLSQILITVLCCMYCSRRSLLRQWEMRGQPKIVLTCKNQNEMYADLARIIFREQ